MPAKVLKQMLVHPLTTAGIDKFAADWQSARVRGVAHGAGRGRPGARLVPRREL